MEQETWVNIISLIPFYAMVIIDNRNGVAYGEWPKLLYIVRTARIVRILRFGFGVGMIVLRGVFGSTQEPGTPKLLTILRRATVSISWFLFLVLSLVCMSATVMFYVELEHASFQDSEGQWVRQNSSGLSDAGSATAFQSIPVPVCTLFTRGTFPQW